MSDSTVKHMFNMDKERFLEYRDRLREVEPSAEQHRAKLVSDRVDLSRSTWLLGWGAILAVWAVASMVLAGQDDLTPFWGQAFAIMFALSGSVSAGLLFNGGRRRQWARSIINNAFEARDVLEGEEGFIWRFEPFLQDWDHNLPPAVRDTLSGVCEASKKGVLENHREALLNY